MVAYAFDPIGEEDIPEEDIEPVDDPEQVAGYMCLLSPELNSLPHLCNLAPLYYKELEFIINRYIGIT